MVSDFTARWSNRPAGFFFADAVVGQPERKSASDICGITAGMPAPTGDDYA
jgi:hypothetical protein